MAFRSKDDRGSNRRLEHLVVCFLLAPSTAMLPIRNSSSILAYVSAGSCGFLIIVSRPNDRHEVGVQRSVANGRLFCRRRID